MLEKQYPLIERSRRESTSRDRSIGEGSLHHETGLERRTGGIQPQHIEPSLQSG